MLVFEKDVGGPFSSGDIIRYTIEITNIGDAVQPDNPGPEFVDTFPDTLLLISANADSGDVILDKLNNTVTWDGSINPEQTVTISIDTQLSSLARPGDEISNQATLNYSSLGDSVNTDELLSSDPDVEEEESPTNFTVASIVPTLSVWAMGLLGGLLMLGAAGSARLRRRK